jgi:hypothetical protein
MEPVVQDLDAVTVDISKLLPAESGTRSSQRLPQQPKRGASLRKGAFSLLLVLCSLPVCQVCDTTGVP